MVTHLATGTMVGDDGAGNQIGAAPGAKWVACKNMNDQGWGRDAWYADCSSSSSLPPPWSAPTPIRPWRLMSGQQLLGLPAHLWRRELR
ncbi:MAG: hypothetical protein IPO15_25850 [Anaerolineae bacterium]|uniref:hypothetical protein n=1 Tax=Candidatus Amarolinea dominans TaxID=3140696 RepID=UPI003136EFAD|nr:hypothetical protein [Anaerolineae bacterium]